MHRIDRKALVGRHKIKITKPETLAPLSVGNGEFAYTADITGLQTFPEFHNDGTLLRTMAQWGWHTTPDDHDYELSDTFNMYDSHGRQVPYPSGDESAAGGFGDESPAASWLNRNPHKFDLGRLALILPKVDGREAKIEDLTDIHQELDLWEGLLTSRFTFAGQTVVVETVAHPDQDIVAARITSRLVGDAQMGVRLHFSYGPPDWKQAGDWEQPNRHTTQMSVTGNEYRFGRTMDDTTEYSARAAVSQGTTHSQISQHEHEWTSEGKGAVSVVLAFSEAPIDERHGKLGSFDEVRSAAAKYWKRFWSTGGAIDLSESTDSRWKELERRIVLSQYQTALNCSGSLPPQETGLVQNSWYGKFHLEMHWWHAAHFPLWGREAMLMRSMDYYRRILPVARETAKRIGCRGARWPKMVGPDGRESPNRINPFLTWQQPHPVDDP